MPKGHSEIPGKIADVERLQLEMLHRLCSLELREKTSRDSQDKRIAALETRIAEMNEAFSHARFPRAPQQSVPYGTPN